MVHITGTAFNDDGITNPILQALTVDDSVYGLDGDDILRSTIGFNANSFGGGSFADSFVNELYGGYGNDIYISAPAVSFPIYSTPVFWGGLYGVVEVYEDVSSQDTHDILDMTEFGNVNMDVNFDGQNITVANVTLVNNFGVDGGGNLLAGVDYLSFIDENIVVTIDLKLENPLLNFITNGTDASDFLQGRAQSNLIDGRDGDDEIHGGEGNDFLTGGLGDDRLFGHDGGDTLYGGNGSDKLFGHDGGDTLYGGNGSDKLFGGNGNDKLYGGNGSDVLRGDNNDDMLYGNAGADILYGGAGADSFVFESASAFKASGIDRIADFSIAEGDIINLADVLIGFDVIDSAIADFVHFVDGGSNSRMFVDRDGTATGYQSENIAVIVGHNGLDADTLLADGNLVTV